MASSASTLPWLWVIEALASFKKVDATILIDLVKRTPDISEELGKNAREMVSLRILESFVSKQSGSTKEVSCGSCSKVELDQSEHCEDVVRRVMHEVSSSNPRRVEQEVSKWDLEAFIMHKRSCLPKCTLQQLKDAIIEGNNPSIVSLKKLSGLSVSRQSENRIAVGDGDLNAVEERLEGSCSTDQALAAGQGLEKEDGIIQDNHLIGNLLPSKRNRSDLDTENQPAKSDGHTGIDTGCDPHVHNAKKLKSDTTFSRQAIGQTSVAMNGSELSEDLFREYGQHTVREVYDQAQTCQMEGLEERRVSDSHDQKNADRQMNEAADAGLKHNRPQSSCNNNKVPSDMHKAELHPDLFVNITEGDGESCAEKGISTAANPDGDQHIICDDEARDKCEKPHLSASNHSPHDGSYQNCFPVKARDVTDRNGGQEIASDSDGYQDEKIDVAMKKRRFLSSQCIFSQDSMATVGCAELNVCMKCNKDGQLLVCSATACPLVVHQRCLGSEPSFDDTGNFYCPFCAYSRAIAEYLEVKKKASSARKDLAAFIGLDNGFQANKLSGSNLLREHDCVNGKTQAQKNADHGNEITKPNCGKNVKDQQQVQPSASCVNGIPPCQAEHETVNDETICALMEGRREAEKMVPECQSESGLEGRKIEAQAVCKLREDNLSYRDAKIFQATNRHADDGKQKEDLHQPINDPSEAPQNVGAEESSEENDKPTSKYFIRFRKDEKQCTYPAIPQLRRKKVPWTAVEEEKLKEGVRVLSSVHDRNIPWKKILEFGSDVFQKGRTTIDLKDKWRNMCKGSPKSK